MGPGRHHSPHPWTWPRPLLTASPIVGGANDSQNQRPSSPVGTSHTAVGTREPGLGQGQEQHSHHQQCPMGAQASPSQSGNLTSPPCQKLRHEVSAVRRTSWRFLIPGVCDGTV